MNVHMDSSSTDKKVQLQCYRCGIKERSLRTCPDPFAPVLAFAPKTPGGKGIRLTQCEEEEGNPENGEQGQESHSTLVVQETNLSSQLEPILENDLSQPVELSEGNWSACWLGDIQQIMTVELLLVQQEYFTPKSETNDSPPSIVVDSGAASSVTGLPRLKAWYRCLGTPISAPKVGKMLTRSDKRFKFGNQMTFDSLGSIDFCGKVPLNDDSRTNKERTLMIHVDVVDLDIPLLLALPSLAKLHCAIDFRKNRLNSPDQSFAKLHVADRNRLTFVWTPRIQKNKEAAIICVQEESGWDGGKLQKLHVQMVRADSTLLHRMLTLSKQKVEISAIRDVIQKCGCIRADAIPQAPRSNRYHSVAPGEEIFTDLYYPMGEEKKGDARTYPAILCICAFSRFVMSRFLVNVRPQTIVSCLLNRWIPLMGTPNRIMVDHGTSFQ